MSNIFEGFAPQGWQCPICRRVYSPTTPMCYYCGNGKEITTTTTNIETPKNEEDFFEKWEKAIAELNAGIMQDMEPREKFCS